MARKNIKLDYKKFSDLSYNDLEVKEKKEEFRDHLCLDKFYLKTKVILKIIIPQKKGKKLFLLCKV